MSITVQGNIVGTTGAALQNAKVTLRPVASSLAPRQFTFSDAQGNYSLTISTQGYYQIIATSDGVIFPHPRIVKADTTNNISNLNFAAVALTAANS
jgi:hypothetical protein